MKSEAVECPDCVGNKVQFFSTRRAVCRRCRGKGYILLDEARSCPLCGEAMSEKDVCVECWRTVQFSIMDGEQRSTRDLLKDIREKKVQEAIIELREAMRDVA